MSIRRRLGDDDWDGAAKRTTLGAPPSGGAWADDVSTRLGQLELDLRDVIEHLKANNELGAELLAIFQRSKRVGLALVGMLAFLGYSGIVALWDWLQKHLR